MTGALDLLMALCPATDSVAICVPASQVSVNQQHAFRYAEKSGSPCSRSATDRYLTGVPRHFVVSRRHKRLLDVQALSRRPEGGRSAKILAATCGSAVVFCEHFSGLRHGGQPVQKTSQRCKDVESPGNHLAAARLISSELGDFSGDSTRGSSHAYAAICARIEDSVD